MTPQEFIRTVAGTAVQIGQRYDVPPSLLIAQPILESQSGNSLLATKYNNLTGMKATGKTVPGVWNGEKINLPTHEVINGLDVTIPQNFRVYEVWEKSIEDLADRYANRFKLTLAKVGGDSNRFLAEPGMGEAMRTGYATDPNYQAKIESIITRYNLKQFDNVVVSISPGEKKKAGSSETKAA